MSWLHLVLGVSILVLTWLDVLWTTLTLDGGGPLTRRWCRLTGALHRSRTFLQSKWLRTKAGALTVLGNVALWVALVWLGWWLVFSAEPAAVIHSKSEQPAGAIDRLYFVGFAVTTLGTGDFVAQGEGFRLLTTVSATSGFVLLTLSLAYFIPVLTAAVEQRRLASYISTLGARPADVLDHGYRDGSFHWLTRRFDSLARQALTVDQQHAAYPVLYQFFVDRRADSLRLSMARLAEVIVLLRHGVAPHARPQDRELRSLSIALSRYFGMLALPGRKSEAEPPPPPDLAELEARGLPVVSRSRFLDALDELQADREQIQACLRRDGWQWQDMSRQEASRHPSLRSFGMLESRETSRSTETSSHKPI